jgi:predicted double-glycine peptidase
MLWLQLVAIGPLAYLGTRAGLRVGRSARWWAAFAAALAWVGLVIAGHRLPALSLVPPVSWAVDVTVAPFLMAFLIPAMFAALVPRLPKQRRTFITVVTGLMVINYALLPAACPLAVRPALEVTRTKFDPHGVCLQTHPYTCGPSATVTCLRTLGVAGDEGPLSIAARCGPMVGTDARFLAGTVNGLYGDQGVRAECRYERSVETLRVPAVVAMDMPVIGGHFIAVLKVTEKEVLVGDPYSGRGRLSRQDFEQFWTGITITFRREGR